MGTHNTIDLDILPKVARAELRDFYEFLRGKYAAAGKKTGKQATNAAELFFERVQRHSVSLPESYTFNRDEIHER